MKEKQAATDTDKYLKILNDSFTGITAMEVIRDTSDKIIDFKYIFVNRKSEEMLGVTNLTGKRVTEVFPSFCDTPFFDYYVKVVETGDPVDITYFYPDSLNAWYRVVATRSEDGLVTHFLDVTKQQEQLKEIARLEEIYRTFVHMLEDTTVLMYDDQLRITFLDGNSLPIFKEEIAIKEGKLLTEAIKETYLTTLLPSLEASLKGKAASFELIINGYFHLVNISFVKREGNIFVGLLMIESIQYYKEIEQELQDKIGELEKTNENLEQFAYVASHDLQEPLRKIRAFGDRLTTKFEEKLGQQGKDYIHRMQSAAERMQSLINDLLQFSRVSRNKGTLRTVNLDEVIGEVVNDLEISIKEKDVKVNVVEPLPAVKGDATQLRQVIQNLISNAIKFAKENVPPEVLVTVAIREGEELLPLWKGAIPYKKYYEITFTDNGIGFDNQYKEKIFTIFQRLHGRGSYAGTGIGLAICRKIMEHHQGYITADGTENQGAQFKVFFPFFKR
ncbi:MAG: ATP-binding protein [Thermonemataceae bacterium]